MGPFMVLMGGYSSFKGVFMVLVALVQFIEFLRVLPWFCGTVVVLRVFSWL